MKIKKKELSAIFEGKRTIWALECDSYRDVFAHFHHGYFDDVVSRIKNGDVLFAFGNDDTHVYILHKLGKAITPSSLVAFQNLDSLLKKKKSF